MILIIAPYSPPSRLSATNLGASRKLETILLVLSKLDNNFVLINSAHNETIAATFSTQRVIIAGIELTEITPPTYSNRALGKLKNLFCINQMLNELKKIGQPQFLWLYNGYAFEMLFALKAKKTLNVPIILEFEDWHFSRGRGFNPKPYIDYFFWRLAATTMSGAFVVNNLLANKMQGLAKNVELLPGIVPQVLADIASRSPPFKTPTDTINIGFFSGLNSEKGADIVLQLAHKLPDGYVLHVTGSGAMGNDFEQTAKSLYGRVCYYGRVEDKTLYQIIAKCDVMLNPHASIENMNNGVFPFKVIEAVASGRLLISTPLPTEGLCDVLVGVQFVNHSVTDFLAAILVCRDHYMNNSLVITGGASNANVNFGELALLEKINRMITTERCID
jgi:glycosyltransferase involved in cell wall biosynthesis